MDKKRSHSMRATLTVAAVALSLAACGPEDGPGLALAPATYYAQTYAAVPEEMFVLPAINLTKVDPQYLRQAVKDPTGEAPGTIVVDTSKRFLYLVMEGGKAMRYGIGIGREGFAWSGRAYVGWKRAWPTWTPPREMIEREPDLEKYADGMPPSLENPLGARAIYIFQNGQDTLYRFHGTNEPWTIARRSPPDASACSIRM